MLQRYCFNGRLASISYVVICVFVLFCVGVDFGWVGKREKKSSQTSEGYGLRAMV